ncbi:MAG: thioredoxin-dependent thiol peroxidase [Parvularcula sp.]
MLNPGDKAPAFSLPSEDGPIRLADFKGQKLVVFFYPKDDTPGCTKEAIGFSEQRDAFTKEGVALLGISKDSVEKHAKFRAKHDLTVPLASDEDGKVLEAYGVWVEKTNYGRKYMGIERTSFLIDEKGKILQIWRKVRVKDHVDSVLQAVRDLA